MFVLGFPKRQRTFSRSLSEKVKASIELNQNTLCVYNLSKNFNSGMSEHVNLELSRKDKGDDQLTKSNICTLLLLLQLPPLLLLPL